QRAGRPADIDELAGIRGACSRFCAARRDLTMLASGERFLVRAATARDRGERRARGAARVRNGEVIDDITQRALVAPRDAELVAAPQAEQQVPSPFERQVRTGHERAVSLVALAEPMS